jgi:hypothetical protein
LSGAAVSTEQGIEKTRPGSGLAASTSAASADTGVLAQLDVATSQLWNIRDLDAGLQEILETAIALLGADMGNVQLLDVRKKRLSISAASNRTLLIFSAREPRMTTLSAHALLPKPYEPEKLIKSILALLSGRPAGHA